MLPCRSAALTRRGSRSARCPIRGGIELLLLPHERGKLRATFLQWVAPNAYVLRDWWKDCECGCGVQVVSGVQTNALLGPEKLVQMQKRLKRAITRTRLCILLQRLPGLPTLRVLAVVCERRRNSIGYGVQVGGVQSVWPELHPCKHNFGASFHPTSRVLDEDAKVTI